MPALKYPIPPATICDIAAASGCSARTVRRYLAGHGVSGSTFIAVSHALRVRKLASLVRATPYPETGEQAPTGAAA